MIVVLAEKPSVARDLARFLGAKTKRQGFMEGNGYQVTWAYGHLVTLKEPHDYDRALKRWSLGPLPIIPDRFGLKVIPTAIAKKQFRIVKTLLRGADEVICATDAGREGELIFRYIRQLAGATRKPAKRLWLSSLTPQAIRNGFESLQPLDRYDGLFDAARCRSESDWIVGLNATRNYTVRFGHKGQLWSVGRVQTPVLAMIVERDAEIAAFTPEQFWNLLTVYRGVTFKHTGKRFDAAEPAAELLRKVQGQPFSITDLTTKDQRVPPPLLYDLTDLQRDMNRRFGMSASATLKTAQELYEKKLLTYPRTDSRYLSHDMKGQVNRALGDLAARFEKPIGGLDLERIAFSKRVFNDAKVSDHHAIIPTGKLPASLGGTLGKVFDAVATRFIAAFYPWCEKRNTSVKGEAATVPFQARGTQVVKPGWTVLYPKRKSPERRAPGADADQELPEFRQGESGPHEPSIKDGMTQPPKHYTESSLLSAMETCGKSVDDEGLREALKERGLGTPATRAQIIETLIGRVYITRNGKQLLASDLGRYLIARIRNPQLKSAELTGQWEERLKLIEKGTLSARDFMEAIGDYTRSILEDSALPQVDMTRIGDCPLCGNEIIEGKRGVGCSKWKEGCPFVLWHNYRGTTFDGQQVRQLIQLRGLCEPTTIIDEGGMRQVLLNMDTKGAITEIPVPSAPTSRQGSGRGKKGYASRRRPKAASSQKDGSNAPTAPAPQTAAPLGTCPACGKDVVETAKAYGCSAWRDGCKFAIWKRTAGKRISLKTAEALLANGKTTALKGFKSKAGRPFGARLVIKDGAVAFDFGT
ncbi:MAG: DNA topoisomerase 3 [Lentisphaerae bacterium]|nr:DNA topoisomerase 3 [Lentisphaerota bacterium]MBT4820189.1 DNA topoisomerase 3 [Lentisphaerota bacterium]MBT5609797.1 DNA topoisomerase 3 [Lentisphaerota bacterium]MBT7846946.1 DNA topoisomerase 3 [Lentisphaerota bacterium]